MDAHVVRGQRRRKNWRRLMRASWAQVFEMSLVGLVLFMLASAFVGCAIGLTVFNAVYNEFFSCVRVP